METTYTKQAQDFAAKHSLSMAATYKGHFPRLSKAATAQFSITLTRGTSAYTFDFSDSINDSWKYRSPDQRGKTFPGLPQRLSSKSYPTTGQPFDAWQYRCEPTHETPSLYDILACLTKSDPGTFADFCSDYGYDTDSIKARDLYFAIQEEWSNVNRLFFDCMDELQEIN